MHPGLGLDKAHPVGANAMKFLCVLLIATSQGSECDEWSGEPTDDGSGYGGVRLVSGDLGTPPDSDYGATGSASAGRVEVRWNGVWGTVCDDSWTEEDARVVCNELGFASYAIAKPVGSRFGRGCGQPIVLDNLECDGTEATLEACAHAGWLIHDCDHDEDAGVECIATAAADEVRLVGGATPYEGRVEVLIPGGGGAWGTVCDNAWDNDDAAVVCTQLGFATEGETSWMDIVAKGGGHFAAGSGAITYDGVACDSSESSLASCPMSVTVDSGCGHDNDAGVSCERLLRLVDGSIASEGRLEVYHDGEWGSVCDDSFGATEAAVVCRELGYGSTTHSGQAFHSAHYGRGSDEQTIWLDNLACAGTEKRLASCTHTPWGESNCW